MTRPPCEVLYVAKRELDADAEDASTKIRLAFSDLFDECAAVVHSLGLDLDDVILEKQVRGPSDCDPPGRAVIQTIVRVLRERLPDR